MSSSGSDSEDSVHEEKELARVDTGSGIGYKVKKFIASKTVGTKAGRRVIINMMGEEGDNIVQALKSAATKFSSNSKAKKVKKSFLKLVLKGKLMADEKRITAHNTKHAAEPINDLVLSIEGVLKKEEVVEGDIDSLASKFNKVRDVVYDIVKPHMQAKNSTMMLDVFNFYGDPQFLHALLLDAQYKEERETLRNNLGSIVQDIKKQMEMFKKQPVKCYINACPSFQCWPAGDFVGSEYCARHHLEHVMNDLESPNFSVFANPSVKQSHFFLEYLKSVSPTVTESKESDKYGGPLLALFRFHDAVNQYKRLRRNLKKPRAELIYVKFLKDRNLALLMGLSEGVLDKISEELGAVRLAVSPGKLGGVLHTLYNEASDEAEEALKKEFAKFIASDFFNEYKVSVTLPRDLLDEARRPRASIIHISQNAEEKKSMDV